jgi:hypothetical protein
MTGTPGDRRVELPAPIEDSDGDDTTTAEGGPPASRPDVPDEEAGNDADDRTVQQQVSPPGGARKPGARAVAAPPNGTSSTAAPSTQPSSGPPITAKPSPPKITEGSVSDSIDLTEELTEDDEIEDSITTTAPRIDPAILPHDPVERAGRGLPLSIPGSVEIRTVEHDELLDETEVRTRPGHVPLTGPVTLRGSPAPPAAMPARPPAPRPAAGRPPSLTPHTEVDDRDDDGVTTEAPAPRVGSVPDLGIEIPASIKSSTAKAHGASVTDIVEEAPTRPGVVEEAPTRPGLEGVGEPATRPRLPESPAIARASEPETSKRIDVSDSYANEDDDDESVTTRGRALEPPYADESVTSRAPAVPMSVVQAALERPNAIHDATLDDGTDGTTQKLKKSRDAAPSSPADGEAESITTQAPGPLTNILRVIASGSSPEMVATLPRLDDDEPPENRTAVMANAPLKRIASESPGSPAPSVRAAGGSFAPGPQGSAAPQLEPTSESGLRVARSGSGSGERVSLGALAAGDGRNSGVGPIGNALASDGSVSSPIDIRAHAATEMAFPPGQQPSVHDVDLGKGPRYGLLVGIVAVISVIVPVTLFLVLRRGPDTVTPGVPSEPASEIQKRDGARAKGTRGKNGAFVAVPTASASASASASAAPSAAPSARPAPGQRGGFPFRR